MTGLTLRVINNVNKRMEVKPKFYDAFKGEGFPSEFSYTQKVPPAGHPVHVGAFTGRWRCHLMCERQVFAHLIPFADASLPYLQQPLRSQKLRCPCLHLMRPPSHRACFCG